SSVTKNNRWFMARRDRGAFGSIVAKFLTNSACAAAAGKRHSPTPAGVVATKYVTPSRSMISRGEDDALSETRLMSRSNCGLAAGAPGAAISTPAPIATDAARRRVLAEYRVA